MSKDFSEDNILKKQGYKNTKSRKAIIEVLENAHEPLTAEEIFLQLKEKGAAANLSTVYRTLELMDGRGLVAKTMISDGKAHFELLGGSHRHHLVCTQCKKMVSIDSCPIEKLEQDVSVQTKFNITGHRLELYGICPDCTKVDGQ